MNIQSNVSLADYSTMGLGGIAKHLAVIETKEDLIEALNFAKLNKLATLTVGSGSNIIWRDEGFKGLILVCRIRGFEVESEDDSGADMLIGAGEEWDLVVDRAVSLGLSGIECLSLIPGKAGATPVQNVGAYGQEIAETLVSLDAYDQRSQNFLTMLNEECEFSYRASCFKTQPGRYFILSIRLRLNKSQMRPPFYMALQQYLSDNRLQDYSPKALRQAVISIRQSKLPDPKKVKNCGSFFKNPLISNEAFAALAKDYPELPHWKMNGDKVKLPAAWLIDQAGFKDFSDPIAGISTWSKQSLILVNDSASTTADLLSVKKRIENGVNTKFGIQLIQEPELLP